VSLGALLGEADSLLAITGAGVSAESGIPTYRGVAGLYNADDGVEIMEQLSYDSYRRDPAATFALLNGMLANCQHARPNTAHTELARYEQRMSCVTLLTQNVDGLHQEAGSKEPIEMHGNILRLRCPRCRHSQTLARGKRLPEQDRCPACGNAALRHDVVLFGEQLDPATIERYTRAIETSVDLCLVIGTTALFPYIQQAARSAQDLGATLVEINPDETPLTDACDLVIREPAGIALGNAANPESR